MTVASANPSVENKRRHARKPFLWKCRIPLMGTKLSGLLMNLSLTGAKIRVRTPYSAGQGGEIEVPKLSLTFKFKVVWNDGETIGIKFEETPAMKASEFRGLFQAA